MSEKRLIDANALREYIVACQMVNDESFYYSFAEARVFDRVLEDIDAAPTINPEALRTVAHIVWKERPKTFVTYDQVPPNEYCKDGKMAYTRRVVTVENYRVPFCSNCDHRLDDIAGSFCPVCGAILEERRLK